MGNCGWNQCVWNWRKMENDFRLQQIPMWNLEGMLDSAEGRRCELREEWFELEMGEMEMQEDEQDNRGGMMSRDRIARRGREGEDGEIATRSGQTRSFAFDVERLSFAKVKSHLLSPNCSVCLSSLPPRNPRLSSLFTQHSSLNIDIFLLTLFPAPSKSKAQCFPFVACILIGT